MAIRRRLQPTRPHGDSPEQVAALGAAPADEGFITGNGIAVRCRYVLNYDVLAVSEDVDNNWWFCKADYLEYFFAKHAPRDEFVLFSHNSDRAVGADFRRELRRRSLIARFAQNAAIEHPKLRALPIGIANPHWPHGDTAALRRIQGAPPSKRRLFDVAFSVDTNPVERGYCLAQTGLTPSPPKPFESYLVDLGSSYFCVAPRGKGIDTHRIWEALYLRTIPVVTRSVLTDQHPDLPLIVLDDWAAFGSIDFSPETYARIWGRWDPYAIRLDRYVERLAASL
jgi:hypothetical protein